MRSEAEFEPIAIRKEAGLGHRFSIHALFLCSASTCLAANMGCRAGAPVLTEPNLTLGKAILLPGITNFMQELSPFVTMLREAHPQLSIELRRWGPAFRPFHNLFSEPANRRRAAELAEEIADYRRKNPHHPVYLLGYSGGGAMAVFIVEALPEDVSIDRLILLAPAVSQSYPVVEKIMPKIRDFAVVYASRLDAPVGVGTRLLGTLDRKWERSAGSRGFCDKHDRLVQVDWNPTALRKRHFGNHASYMSRAWQREYLLPAFDPAGTTDVFRSLGNHRRTTEDE